MVNRLGSGLCVIELRDEVDVHEKDWEHQVVRGLALISGRFWDIQEGKDEPDGWECN